MLGKVIDDCVGDEDRTSELGLPGQEVERIELVSEMRLVPDNPLALRGEVDCARFLVYDWGAADSDFTGEILILGSIVRSWDGRRTAVVQVSSPYRMPCCWIFGIERI